MGLGGGLLALLPLLNLEKCSKTFTQISSLKSVNDIASYYRAVLPMKLLISPFANLFAPSFIV